MKPFKRRRRGTVTASFEQSEALLVANLVSQVVELLRDRNGESVSSADPLAAMVAMTGPMNAPEDPVLARLLPDAYSDKADAAEFRRFTESSITSSKVHNADVVLECLQRHGMADGSGASVDVELTNDEVMAWMQALNDVRLALAERLGIETEDDIEIVANTTDEQVLAMGDIYDWLGYVVESLVHVASQGR